MNMTLESVTRALLALLLTALLGACASLAQREAREAPRFALAPALYGGELAVQQRLRFTREGQSQTLDTYLEIDAQGVRMAALAAGQVAAGFDWDGQRLDERRAPWMPAAFDARDVLSDLQFSLWPLAALRAALPPGWRIEAAAGTRRLLGPSGTPAIVARQEDARHLKIEHPALGLQLEIESAPGGSQP